jgi:hypothetical protein
MANRHPILRSKPRITCPEACANAGFARSVDYAGSLRDAFRYPADVTCVSVRKPRVPMAVRQAQSSGLPLCWRLH